VPEGLLQILRRASHLKCKAQCVRIIYTHLLAAGLVTEWLPVSLSGLSLVWAAFCSLAAWMPIMNLGHVTFSSHGFIVYLNYIQNRYCHMLCTRGPGTLSCVSYSMDIFTSKELNKEYTCILYILFEIHLNVTETFSLYLTGNALRLYDNHQPVNAVSGEQSLFIVGIIRNR
jgi:hypothetical protein